MEGMQVSDTQGNTAPAEPVSPPAVDRPAAECRVLIVENDMDSMAGLQLKLSQAGFKVSTLNRAEDARGAVDRDNPHLIMIDWDLPAMIAMDLVRHVRRDSSRKGPRLIALSSFAGEQHIVSGFELGVDDYVIKPFSVPEVVARVRAVLRPQRSMPSESSYLEFRELQMDADGGRVTIVDKTVRLRHMEFQLLLFLMRRPERAYARETLLHQVWGRNCNVGLRAVDVTIQRIRRALAPHGCGEYLQTIRGVGYRLSVGHT
jgi:two-component system phosphate regulon response regulator PhoB